MNLQLVIIWCGALKRRDQTFVAALVDLRHAVSWPATSLHLRASAHAGIMDGRKVCLRSQALSKRKRGDFGIVVDMERKIGVWSEVGLALGGRVVTGKVVV